MATRLETVEPLELPSIRDDAREREPWSSIATTTVVLAVAAAILVALALTLADDASAGRVIGAVLVASWCAAAIFVARHRPREPLGTLMAFAALAGAVALFGAALLARGASADGARDWAAEARAIAIALLPAIGVHLALGVPDGLLRTTTRRVATALFYVAAVVLAAVLIDRKPHVTLTPIAIVAGAGAVVGLVGYFVRCRRARSAYERARLQWIAWAVVVAAAVSLVAFVLHALVDWPQAVRGVAVCTTMLVPLASRWVLPNGSPSASTASSSTRSPSPGSRRWWRRATCSSCSGSGVNPPATSRRCSACRWSPPRSRRCCGSRCGNGSPTSPPDACTGSGTPPTRCCAPSAAGSRARSRSTSCSSNLPSP